MGVVYRRARRRGPPLAPLRLLLLLLAVDSGRQLPCANAHVDGECELGIGKVLIEHDGAVHLVDCPVGVVCDDPCGTAVEHLHLLPGFWRATDTTTNVRACPHPEWCLGTSQSLCIAGHSGPLCSGACDDGMFMAVNGGGCQSCTDEASQRELAETVVTASLISSLVVSLLVAIAALSSCVRCTCTASVKPEGEGATQSQEPVATNSAGQWGATGDGASRRGSSFADGMKPASQSWSAPSPGASHLAGLATTAKAKALVAGVVRRGLNGVQRRAAVQRAVSMNKLKTLVSGLQLVWSFNRTLAVRWTPRFATLLRYTSVLDFDVVSWSGFACAGRTYYTDLVVVCALPIKLAFLVYLWGKCGRRSRQKAAWMMLHFIYFLVFIPVNTKIFGALQCVQMEDGESYLAEDLSINCNAEDRTKWLAFVFCAIGVYAVGAPLWFLIDLCRHRGTLNPRHGAFDSPFSAGDPLWEQAALEWREQQEAEVGHLRGLYLIYRPTHYYFEVILVALKTLMTGLISFASPGTATQVFSALALSATCLFVFAEVKPYVDSRDDKLMNLSIFSVVMTAAVALLIRADPTLGERSHIQEVSVDFALVGIHLVVAVATVGYLIQYEVFDRWKWARQIHEGVPVCSRHFCCAYLFWRRSAPEDCRCRACRAGAEPSAASHDSDSAGPRPTDSAASLPIGWQPPVPPPAPIRAAPLTRSAGASAYGSAPAVASASRAHRGPSRSRRGSREGRRAHSGHHGSRRHSRDAYVDHRYDSDEEKAPWPDEDDGYSDGRYSAHAVTVLTESDIRAAERFGSSHL